MRNPNRVWARVSIGVLIIVVGLALLSGTTGQVYAYYGHGHGWGGWGGYGHGWGWGGYGWGGYGYYPYFSYYYYPYSYYSYYPYYSSYYYPYSYSYGYGAYGSYGYNQQYQLTVNTNPSSLSSSVSGAGQFSPGSSASFSANQNVIQVSQDTRYVFAQWTGDYNGNSLSGSITMDAAKTVTAVYQLQYYLSVAAQPSSAGTLQGSGWFNSGTSTVISIPSQVISTQNSGSRLVFSGWNVDGSVSQTGAALTIQMNGPHTVVAQYSQQYYLTLSSDQGSVTGGGWYDAGSTASISASTPPNPSYGVSMVFNGWQGDIQSSSQSTTVMMDGPKSATATWRADPTVLYVTVAVIVAAVAVAMWVGAVAWRRRNNSAGMNWQATPSIPPNQTAPTSVSTAPTNSHLNPTSYQSGAQSHAHRRRRSHAPAPSQEPSATEGTNGSNPETG